MSNFDHGPLSSYNSLVDANLTGFFASTRLRRHLYKAGLITRNGEIVSENMYRLNLSRKEHKKQVKDMLAQAIVHKTLDLERARQAEIRKTLEQIAKIQLVRRVRDSRARKREEDVLPYLKSASSLRSSRSPHAPTGHLAPRNRSVSAPARKGKRTLSVLSSSYDDDDDDEAVIYLDDEGRPISPSHAEVTKGSRHTSRESTDTRRDPDNSRHPATKDHRNPRNLAFLDTAALRKYVMLMSKMEQGRLGASPYLIPQVPLPPKSPRASQNPRNIRRYRPIKRDTQSASPKRPATALHPEETAKLYKGQQESMCEVGMHYHGSSLSLAREQFDRRQEILVQQQHCGGNTLTVFRDKLEPNSDFSFLSYRHRGYPFSLTIYVDDTMYCRVSTCCEYRHKQGGRIGGKTGHFSIRKITGAVPCYRCQVEKGIQVRNQAVRPKLKRPPKSLEEVRVQKADKPKTLKSEAKKTRKQEQDKKNQILVPVEPEEQNGNEKYDDDFEEASSKSEDSTSSSSSSESEQEEECVSNGQRRVSDLARKTKALHHVPEQRNQSRAANKKYISASLDEDTSQSSLNINEISNENYYYSDSYYSSDTFYGSDTTYYNSDSVTDYTCNYKKLAILKIIEEEAKRKSKITLEFNGGRPSEADDLYSVNKEKKLSREGSKGKMMYVKREPERRMLSRCRSNRNMCASFSRNSTPSASYETCTGSLCETADTENEVSDIESEIASSKKNVPVCVLSSPSYGYYTSDIGSTFQKCGAGNMYLGIADGESQFSSRCNSYNSCSKSFTAMASQIAAERSSDNSCKAKLMEEVKIEHQGNSHNHSHSNFTSRKAKLINKNGGVRQLSPVASARCQDDQLKAKKNVLIVVDSDSVNENTNHPKKVTRVTEHCERGDNGRTLEGSSAEEGKKIKHHKGKLKNRRTAWIYSIDSDGAGYHGSRMNQFKLGRLREEMKEREQQRIISRLDKLVEKQSPRRHHNEKISRKSQEKLNYNGKINTIPMVKTGENEHLIKQAEENAKRRKLEGRNKNLEGYSKAERGYSRDLSPPERVIRRFASDSDSSHEDMYLDLPILSKPSSVSGPDSDNRAQRNLTPVVSWMSKNAQHHTVELDETFTVDVPSLHGHVINQDEEITVQVIETNRETSGKLESKILEDKTSSKLKQGIKRDTSDMSFSRSDCRIEVGREPSSCQVHTSILDSEMIENKPTQETTVWDHEERDAKSILDSENAVKQTMMEMNVPELNIHTQNLAQSQSYVCGYTAANFTISPLQNVSVKDTENVERLQKGLRKDEVVIVTDVSVAKEKINQGITNKENEKEHNQQNKVIHPQEKTYTGNINESAKDTENEERLLKKEEIIHFIEVEGSENQAEEKANHLLVNNSQTAELIEPQAHIAGMRYIVNEADRYAQHYQAVCEAPVLSPQHFLNVGTTISIVRPQTTEEAYPVIEPEIMYLSINQLGESFEERRNMQQPYLESRKRIADGNVSESIQHSETPVLLAVNNDDQCSKPLVLFSIESHDHGRDVTVDVSAKNHDHSREVCLDVSYSKDNSKEVSLDVAAENYDHGRESSFDVAAESNVCDRESSQAVGAENHDQGRESSLDVVAGSHDHGRESSLDVAADNIDHGRESSLDVVAGSHDHGRESSLNDAAENNGHGRESSLDAAAENNDQARKSSLDVANGSHDHGKESSLDFAVEIHDHGRDPSLDVVAENNDHGRESSLDVAAENNDHGRESSLDIAAEIHDHGRESSLDVAAENHDLGKESSLDVAAENNGQGRESSLDVAAENNDQGRESSLDVAAEIHDHGRESSLDVAAENHDLGKESSLDVAAENNDQGREFSLDVAAEIHDHGRESSLDVAAGSHDHGRESSLDVAAENNSQGRESSLDVAAESHDHGRESSLDVAADNNDQGRESSLDVAAESHDHGRESSLDVAADNNDHGRESSLDVAAENNDQGRESSLDVAAEIHDHGRESSLDVAADNIEHGRESSLDVAAENIDQGREFSLNVVTGSHDHGRATSLDVAAEIHDYGRESSLNVAAENNNHGRESSLVVAAEYHNHEIESFLDVATGNHDREAESSLNVDAESHVDGKELSLDVVANIHDYDREWSLDFGESHDHDREVPLDHAAASHDHVREAFSDVADSCDHGRETSLDVADNHDNCRTPFLEDAVGSHANDRVASLNVAESKGHGSETFLDAATESHDHGNEVSFDVATDGHDKEISLYVAPNSHDTQISLDVATDSHDKEISLDVAPDSHDKEISLDVAIDSHDRETPLDVATDSHDKEVSLDVATDSHDKEISLDFAADGHEKEISLNVATDSHGRQISLDVATDSHDRETPLDVATDSHDRETPLDVATDSHDRETPLDVATNSHDKEISLDVATNSHDKEISLDVATNSNDKEISLDVATDSHDKEISLDVATDNHDKETTLDVDIDSYDHDRDVSLDAAIDSHARDRKDSLHDVTGSHDHDKEDSSQQRDISEHKDFSEHKVSKEHNDANEHTNSSELTDLSEHKDLSELKNSNEQKDLKENKNFSKQNDSSEHQDSSEQNDSSEHQDSGDNMDSGGHKDSSVCKNFNEHKDSNDQNDSSKHRDENIESQNMQTVNTEYQNVPAITIEYKNTLTGHTEYLTNQTIDIEYNNIQTGNTENNIQNGNTEYYNLAADITENQNTQVDVNISSSKDAPHTTLGVALPIFSITSDESFSVFGNKNDPETNNQPPRNLLKIKNADVFTRSFSHICDEIIQLNKKSGKRGRLAKKRMKASALHALSLSDVSQFDDDLDKLYVMNVQQGSVPEVIVTNADEESVGSDLYLRNQAVLKSKEQNYRFDGNLGDAAGDSNRLASGSERHSSKWYQRRDEEDSEYEEIRLNREAGLYLPAAYHAKSIVSPYSMKTEDVYNEQVKSTNYGHKKGAYLTTISLKPANYGTAFAGGDRHLLHAPGFSDSLLSTSSLRAASSSESSAQLYDIKSNKSRLEPR